MQLSRRLGHGVAAVHQGVKRVPSSTFFFSRSRDLDVTSARSCCRATNSLCYCILAFFPGKKSPDLKCPNCQAHAAKHRYLLENAEKVHAGQPRRHSTKQLDDNSESLKATVPNFWQKVSTLLQRKTRILGFCFYQTLMESLCVGLDVGLDARPVHAF